MASQDVTEFTVDGVDIVPEEEPMVSVGRMNRGTFGSITGSYVPTALENDYLYLDNGKFFYADAHVQLQGYRAYFYFQDVLEGYDASVGAHIVISIDNGMTTDVGTSLMNNERMNGEIFNLAGQRVTQSAKGLYITNGRKVVKK